MRRCLGITLTKSVVAVGYHPVNIVCRAGDSNLLRDVVSSADFALGNGGGRALAYDASVVFGVRPFALLV